MWPSPEARSVRSFSRICPIEETYRKLYKQSNIPEHLPKGIPQFHHKSLILVYIFPLVVGSSLATAISALNRHSLQTLNRAFLPGANDVGMLQVELGELAGSQHTVEQTNISQH